MIYTVEIDFQSPENEPEWNRWYHGNLPLILTVPGFETAQRLERVGAYGPRFLAVYTVSSAAVFTSDAYRAVGGGGAASAQWRDWIERRRNLYSGLDRVPAITVDALLALTETDPALLELPDALFVPLEAIGLARSPARRYLSVLAKGAADMVLRDPAQEVALYASMAPQHRAIVRNSALPPKS
jgi:hypothetical protein